MTTWQYFRRQIERELVLRFRDLHAALNAMLFFLIIIIFLPLTVPANSQYLAILSPGIIWLGVIFASFLYSESLFGQDYSAGILEQWVTIEAGITVLVLAKIVVHWLLLVLSIVILSPLFAILLKFDLWSLLVIDCSIIVASPSIVVLCALAAAFSATINQKTLILALVVLPLNIPILILGSSCCSAAILHNNVSGLLALLLAISVVLAFVVPFAIAGILRICLSD